MNEEKYLLELGQCLDNSLLQIRAFSTGQNAYEQVLQLLEKIVQLEQNLRESYELENRFNMIHSQLRVLLAQFQKTIEIQRQSRASTQSIQKLADSETIIYVYLFNAQGATLASWQKMLGVNALKESSINRPIYANQNEIEAMLRTKKNKDQQGYLAIVIEKIDLMQDNGLQDANGYQLLRVRQGALQPENIRYFKYRDKSYSVSDRGELILQEKA